MTWVSILRLKRLGSIVMKAKISRKRCLPLRGNMVHSYCTLYIYSVLMPMELQRINDELMPAMEMDLKLVQLMAYTDWNETMTYKGDKEATPYSYD